MNTPPIEIDFGSVKVMRSHDYCHFEVALSSSEATTPQLIDELRKTAARLADKAVKQYQQAKRAAMRVERQQSDLFWRKSLAEKTPEAERSPEQKADIKAYNDIQFGAQFDYQDDWQEPDDEF
ncbi:MAG: hypothetical protein KGL39_15780 [Patescibacteria group bacterium]|nr:hypothetical protein [Patescibacteria group bacterium]